MGRPLNKKFFGNRNIGRNGREAIHHSHDSHGEGIQHDVPGGDDGIGGEGVASFGTIVAGSGWTTDPEAYVKVPTLPGGVQAEITAHYKALSLAVVSSGSGYDYHNTLPLGGGIIGKVTAIKAVSVTKVNAGDHYNNGDLLEFRTGQFGTDYVIIRVNTVGGASDAPADTLTITDGGGGRRLDSKPTGTLTYQNTLGGTGITFTLDWGVHSADTSVNAGDYTTFPSNPVTDPTHGATFTVTSGLKSVVVTEQGSGYINPADAALLFDNGSANGASATAVLTVDTGAVGSATNQENAIIARVYYDEEVQVADIVKQQGSRSYIVITQSWNEGPISEKDDEPVLARLVARVPQDLGEYAPLKEMTIRATDDNGNTYFVTKLTARRATLHRDTQSGSNAWLFANDASAPWTFDSTANGRVIIENA